MKLLKYVVVHLKVVEIQGIYPASAKREARRIQREIMDRQNFSAREAEEVWIWNIETNRQDP